MKHFKIILSLLIALVTSVSYADLSDSAIVPKDEVNFAKHYLGEIRERNFEYVLSHIDSTLANQVTQEKLEEIAAYFPSGQLLSTTLIGSQVRVFEEQWQGNFSFEYEFESGWALANVVLKRTGDKKSVIGFNVYKTEASQQEINKFTLSGKSIMHYVVLALAFIVPIFILVTLVYCIKTPIPKRKWLWVIFILFSIGAISINWTSGAFGVKLLQFQLFGTGALAASKHAPWIITAGFPLGAIMFWIKRKSYIEQSKVINAEPLDDNKDFGSNEKANS